MVITADSWDFKVTYGSQTFKEASNKVTVFAMVGDGTNKRQFPNQRLEQVRGSGTRHSAAVDGYEDHGYWNQAEFKNEDGTVMCIQASTTLRGSPYNNGAMFIALRADAPLIKVNVNLHPNRNAVHTKLPAFIGRGDILPTSELSDYGVVLYRNYINSHMNQEELDELFEISTLAPGVDKPDLVTIVGDQGEVKRVAVKPEDPRRIRIRRTR